MEPNHVKLSKDEEIIKLLDLKAKYNKTHNSKKGFKEEGWTLIAEELNTGTSSFRCRKKYNDLLKTYRELKAQKDVSKQTSWRFYEMFANLFTIPKQLLDHVYQEKPRGRNYFKWEDKKCVMKLIKLRRDYGPEYKSKLGFAIEGWRKIADTIGSGITATACRKKYMKLVLKFKKLTNRKESETPEYFVSLLKMVSNPKCLLKKVPMDVQSDRNYYKWDNKVTDLIKFRLELDVQHTNSYGFSMLGWEEIAKKIDPENVTAQICRMKFLKLTNKHEKYITREEHEKLLNFEQFCASLIKMVEMEGSRKENMIKLEPTETFTEQVQESDLESKKLDELAVINAINKNHKKFETARQYFKWETPDNTFKLISLVEKYSILYPSNHEDNLSTIIWEKISQDFDNQVTPGSCRKKYSILLKKYKTLRAQHGSSSKSIPWQFYDAIASFNIENQPDEVIFEDSSSDSIQEEVESTKGSKIDLKDDETTTDMETTELTCALCQQLQNDENTTMINITEDQEHQELVDKINFVLFEFSTEQFNHSLYPSICKCCFQNIEAFYKFKKQCRLSLNQTVKVKKTSTAEIVKHEHNYENKSKRSDDKNESPSKSIHKKRRMKKCCTICQRFFYNLKKHKLAAHTGRAKLKECHYCSKSFSTDQLKNHISMHLDERSFQCSICNRRFVDIKNLQHHVDEMHTADSKKYGCGICGAKFVLAISLKKHFLIHGNGLSEVIHKCEVCNKVFISKSGLKIHSLIHELPFACPLCPECFASEPLLEIHCVLQHNEPTPFACFYCNMKFNYQSTMDLHYEEQHEKDIMDYLQEDAVVGIFS